MSVPADVTTRTPFHGTLEDDPHHVHVRDIILGLPKAELHIHLEGSLEPEMLFDLAARNSVDLPYKSPKEVRAAYQFTDLQSFLDIYYQAAKVSRKNVDKHHGRIKY